MTKVIKILSICCFIILLTIQQSSYAQQNIAPETIAVELSSKERLWLNAHQPIRVAFDGFYPPYSFVNQSGQLTGIAYDTIQLISQKLNLKIKVDKRVKWKELYSAAYDKEIDVVATMVNREDRRRKFTFTQPYIFKSLAIFTHITDEKIKSREELSGKTIALLKNYQYSQAILQELPGIRPFYVDNMRDALIAIETRQADAAISFFAASHFLQNKYLFFNIKFVAFYDLDSANESIAVRNDWPILAGIFQKGLDAITETEKRAINNKWRPEIELPVDHSETYNTGEIEAIIAEEMEAISIEAIENAETNTITAEKNTAEEVEANYTKEEESGSIDILSLLGFLFALLIGGLGLWQFLRQKQRFESVQEQLLIANTAHNKLTENFENQLFQHVEQIQKSEQKFRGLVENLQDKYFFFQCDRHGVFTYLSPSVTAILGYRMEDCLMHYSTYLTEHADNAKIEKYSAQCMTGEKSPDFEVEVFDSQGHKHCLEVLQNPVYDGKGICRRVEGIAHDITLLNQTRDRLNWLSYYDDLTGLANRRLFTDRVEHVIAMSHRQQESMALLFLDLDRFKVVNDCLGHAAGDQVLKETATRLQTQLRNSDIAARMGGDEFCLILPNTYADSAEIVAKKLLKSLLTPYDLNNQQFVLGASMGIAIYPYDGSDVDSLLQHADNAMYFAKKEKKGYAFRSSGLHQSDNRRLLLEQNLREALAQNCYDENFQLKLVFQSKHCLRTNKILGYEALMRWQHPEFGNISPIEFIPLAEETGLIVELSGWVITRACLQAIHWSQTGFKFAKIAVNISAVELINLDLASNILEQIDATKAEREWLEIEISETALMKTPDVSAKVMQQLMNAGITITIDDFGTGYSSLSYLKKLPASFIKIDQSFISNVLDSSEDQAVVHAIIGMSHALGKKVIAEGVETENQLRFLAKNGCDIAQGYLFSKPVAAEDIVSMRTGIK